MKRKIAGLLGLCALVLMVYACKKNTDGATPVDKDTLLVNTRHLEYLTVPLNFQSGVKAAAVFIYADAPDYRFVEAPGEGFTCIDDVARAALVYLRQPLFDTDTAMQAKAFRLINFIVELQSDNGYFYNFVYSNGSINKFGITSKDNANWWSWRALQTLTEAAPLLQSKQAALYAKTQAAVAKLVANIKRDFASLPNTTRLVNGITVPQWLPEGSGTDQAALMIVGMIPYAIANNDAVVKELIRKLADGIAMMQQGGAGVAPYGCFLSWENTWHAYGNLQAFALLQAGTFLNDVQYTAKALAEIDHFYTWMLQNGYTNSFELAKNGAVFQVLNNKPFDQIAYGLSPMIFAATEAYKITGNEKYADIAGHLAAWFLGANAAGINLYDVSTGRGYDGLSSASSFNRNAGAESTIEALLSLQRVGQFATVKAALNKYKK